MSTPAKSCVIIVENLPLPFDRRVWQEATALKDDGWQVAIICPKNDKFPESYVEINGIHIYRHPLPLEASGKLGFLLEYGTALFYEFVLLTKIYFKHGFHVVQACNPPDLIFIAVAPFKVLLRKKFVFDHHDICPELFAVKFNKKGFLHKMLLKFEKMTYSSADKVITANETFRNLAIARTGKAPGDITSVYSVPDSKNIARVTPDASLHQGKRLLIGYIGIIGNQDGVDHLVRAIAHLKQELQVNDMRAVIIGDGPELAEIKDLAVQLGVADDITFTGYLTGEPLLRALSAIDIGVIPDPVNEYNDKISMNKVFEYSKLGIPIVSYPLTETRRLLPDAVEVSLNANPDGLAQAIFNLLDDTHRQDMAARAQKIADDNFSWDIEREKYLKVMNGLVEN